MCPDPKYENIEYTKKLIQTNEMNERENSKSNVIDVIE